MKKLFVFFITLLSIGIAQAQVEFKTVKIGSQTWMKENLNVSTFRNGDPVPEAKTAAEWKKAFKDGTPAWCYYDNDPNNGKKYGKMYNGFALNDPRGLAPTGWHISTNDEFTILIEYLGGMNQAGLKLIVPDILGGTNTSGFSGHLAGLRIPEGEFGIIDLATYFGTSTIEKSGRSRFSMKVSYNGQISRDPVNWAVGISIRCIKDDIGTQTWMKENLNVSTFRNGDIIKEAKTKEDWEKAFDSKMPAWCYYNNDPINGKKYGKLYNGYAYNDPRGLAPAGWHIPTNDEFTILIEYLGGMEQAGLKLIVPGLFGGTNTSGFSGLPAGVRFPEKDFFLIGAGTYFATSTIERAGSFSMAVSALGQINRGAGHWAIGISIRCIKDKPITEKPKPPVKPKPVTTTPVAKKPVVTEPVIKKSVAQKPPISISNTQAKGKLNSVKIDKQTWMVKNLDIATYRNGDPIPNVTNDAKWAALTTGAWCYYKNDSATYAATYGKLYNWYAVNDPRGLAPAGWHVPRDDDWTNLENYLGGEAVAGNKMKEVGTEHWKTPNVTATNISGFTCLPGGFRLNDGTFAGVTNFGFWWSSTECTTPGTAMFRFMNNDYEKLTRTNDYKTAGFSIRCFKY